MVFSPLCTLTLMADSDMPQRVAASLTLNPSSFTYWIARRILSGSAANIRLRSSALSVAV